MPHKFKETNENESEINLEDKILFEYVLELDQLEKLTHNVPPSEPTKVRKLEGFDDDSDKMPHFVLFIVLIIFILITGYVIFNALPCGDNVKPIDSMFLGVGHGARAIFVK